MSWLGLVAILALPGGVYGATAQPETIGLRDYVRRALAAGPEVAGAAESLAAARHRWQAALSDAWLPRLSASADAAPWGHNPNNSNAFSSWRLNAADVTYSFGATLNLFNSFEDAFRVRQSRLSRDAADAGLDAARQARALQGIGAFLDLSLQQRLKEVADADAEARRQQYELTRDLYRHGMKSRSDLLKSESDWRASQLRGLAAEAERRKALLVFNLLISRPLDEPAAPAPPGPPPAAAAKPREGERSALGIRPELRRNEAELAQARNAQDQAVKGLLPTLAATLNWKETRAANFGDPALGPATARPFYYAGLSLSLPLGYTGYGETRRYLAARADERRARAERETLWRRVRQEVHVAAIDYEQALGSYELSGQREEVARGNLELVAQQYRQGGADVIKLAQARQDFLEAQVERLRLLHDAHRRWSEYRRAVGERLWE